MVTIGVEVFLELIIRHQHREQCHHYGSTITTGRIQDIVLEYLRAFIVDTGHNSTFVTVIDNQMVSIRTCRRLIFSNSLLVNDTYCAFSGSLHTVDNRMNGLDPRGAES